MLLGKLNDSEKHAFISLAIQAARANDIVTDEEHGMLESYCKEMGIAFFDMQKVDSMDSICDVFNGSDDVTKKIVLMEIIGLMYADGVYDTKEQDFVLSFAQKIGLDDTCVLDLNPLVEKYILITNEIGEFING